MTAVLGHKRRRRRRLARKRLVFALTEGEKEKKEKKKVKISAKNPFPRLTLSTRLKLDNFHVIVIACGDFHGRHWSSNGGRRNASRLSGRRGNDINRLWLVGLHLDKVIPNGLVSGSGSCWLLLSCCRTALSKPKKKREI